MDVNGWSTLLSNSTGYDRRASGLAALDHHIVSKHQKNLGSYSSAHDSRSKHINMPHEHWRAPYMVRRAWRE